MDKFLSRPKSQKMAVTQLGNTTDTDPSDEGSEEFEEAGLAATVNTTLAQLLAQQSMLMEQIAVWREEDF